MKELENMNEIRRRLCSEVVLGSKKARVRPEVALIVRHIITA
jgi:hypothetical protein